MSSHFEDIKGQLGITTKEEETQEDTVSNEAFERLRPGNSKKFSQFIG